MSEPRPSLDDLGQIDLASIDFETALELLDEAVRRLEDGELSLDASIELYEGAVGLSQRCAEILSAAELRLQEIDGESVSEDPDERDRGQAVDRRDGKRSP